MNLNEKICLITGSNSGIGKVTALEIAKKGATVIMLARDKERGQKVLEEVKRISGNEKVELMLCDLASQDSIRKFAKDFKEKYDRLDILINNAGIVLLEKFKTKEGIESTFAINHLGPFLLTNLLLDHIRKNNSARIVNVASMAYKYANLDFDDLNFDHRKYQGFLAYCDSKFANILFTLELAERLKGTDITVNSLHPGAINSNLGSNTTGLLYVLSKVIKFFMTSPEKGAETSIYLATSPDVENVTGEFFSHKKIVELQDKAKNKLMAKKLWEISEKLTNLS